MRTVEQELSEEREYQDAKWGGPAHDDGHSKGDWCDYISEHFGKRDKPLRRRLIVVTSLAIAALQSHLRASKCQRWDLETIVKSSEPYNNERAHRDEKVLRKFLRYQLYQQSHDEWHRILLRIIAKCLASIEFIDREPPVERKSDMTKLIDHLKKKGLKYGFGCDPSDATKQKFPGSAGVVQVFKVEYHHFDENGRALGIDLAD